MENYPANNTGTSSYAKGPQEIPHMEKVIEGEAVVKNRKPRSKLMSAIFSVEDMNEVKDYIIDELILPRVKKTVMDTIVDSIAMILFNDKGYSRSTSSSSSSSRSYVSYNNAYNRRDTTTRQTTRDNYYIDEIYLESMGSAEAVLKELRENLSRYHFVPVASLYEAVGIHPRPTDYDYGWSNLDDAYVVRKGVDGYSFHLAKPVYYRES